jgi:Ca2+-binding RTX toxin-like protein
LTFDPIEGVANETDFHITVQDPKHAAVFDTATVITTLEPADPTNSAPELAIAEATRTTVTAVDNPRAVYLFRGVDLSDADNDELEVTISFADAAGRLGGTNEVGVLSPDGVTRTYTFREKADALDAILHGLTFDPVVVGTTPFTIKVKDNGHVPIEDHVSVVATSGAGAGNNAPRLDWLGPYTTPATDTGDPVQPFLNIDLSDADGDVLTVTIKFTQAHGELDGFGTYLHLTSLVDGVRSYTLTGTADELDAVLRGLTYDPHTGLANTTVFEISVQDAEHMPLTSQATVVTTIEGGGDPTAVLLSDNSIREYPVDNRTLIGEFSTNVAGSYVYKIVVKDGSGNETLVDNDGLFKIENGKLYNATRLGLDFEAARDHFVTVRVMREGLTGPTDWHLDQRVTIALRDVFAENVTGTAEGDRILANIGNDTLRGGGGSDTLSGGLGRDFLTGDGGNDYFLFNKTPTFSSRDQIVDFTVGEDQIQLNATIFRLNQVPGDLRADRFVEGSHATQASHRIIYEKTATSAVLYYDPDGTGSQQKVEIVRFTTIKPNLSLSDFDVIA